MSKTEKRRHTGTHTRGARRGARRRRRLGRRRRRRLTCVSLAADELMRSSLSSWWPRFSSFKYSVMLPLVWPGPGPQRGCQMAVPCGPINSCVVKKKGTKNTHKPQSSVTGQDGDARVPTHVVARTQFPKVQRSTKFR